MADVAVVEADDAEAALGQHGAELLLPAEHLHRQAHDQDQRLAVGIADLLVGDLDAVGRCQPLVGEDSAHPPESSHPTGWTARSRFGRVRTAIVSDLHLGNAFGEDLLRDADLRRTLLDEIASAERLVLLGDILELRELPLPAVLDLARPFFEELGEAMAGREVLLVPGNHDHRLAEPLLESVARENGGGRLGLEQRGEPA